MTRFITYSDPRLAQLEDERQWLLRQLDSADAALDASEPGSAEHTFWRTLVDNINAGLDKIADRIAAREAELDNPTT